MTKESDGLLIHCQERSEEQFKKQLCWLIATMDNLLMLASEPVPLDESFNENGGYLRDRLSGRTQGCSTR